MALTDDLVVGKGVKVIEHETGGRLFNAKVFSEGLNGLDPWSLFFVSHLSRDIPDEIRRKV